MIRKDVKYLKNSKNSKDESQTQGSQVKKSITDIKKRISIIAVPKGENKPL